MKHPKHYDTDEATSKRMAKVKLKRGNGEVAIAKILWREGYRYWLNYKKLPGSPDIAIKKYHIAVFIDGEFWHGYDWENSKLKIKSNHDYWLPKIERNMRRDQEVNEQLKEAGWTVLRFWGFQIKKELDECVRIIKEAVGDSVC